MLIITLAGTIAFFATGGLIFKAWHDASHVTASLISSGFFASFNGLFYLGDCILTCCMRNTAYEELNNWGPAKRTNCANCWFHLFCFQCTCICMEEMLRTLIVALYLPCKWSVCVWMNCLCLNEVSVFEWMIVLKFCLHNLSCTLNQLYFKSI
jgi:hypothetical protein